MTGRKIPCWTGDLNPGRYYAWLFKWTLYQLSYLCPKVLIQIWMNDWERERERESTWCLQFVPLIICIYIIVFCGYPVVALQVSAPVEAPQWSAAVLLCIPGRPEEHEPWVSPGESVGGGLLRCVSVSVLFHLHGWPEVEWGVLMCKSVTVLLHLHGWPVVEWGVLKVYVSDSVAPSSWMTWGGVLRCMSVSVLLCLHGLPEVE